MATALELPRTAIPDAALHPIADKLERGERLTAADALALYRSPDLIGVGGLADAVDPADRTGYAFRPFLPEGAQQPVEEVEIPPEQTLTIRRFLAVAHSPAEALGVAAAEENHEVGVLSVSVHDRNGQPVPGAVLTLRQGNESVPA